MNLVNVGKFLYNNTAVQDGLYKATVRSAEPHPRCHIFQPLLWFARLLLVFATLLELLLGQSGTYPQPC